MVHNLAHPYWPLNTNIIDYVPNTMSVPALLGSFALATFIIIGVSTIVMKRLSPILSRGDKVLFGWFVFCEPSHYFGYICRSWMSAANKIP
jgi:cholestenol delta-isomerase